MAKVLLISIRPKWVGEILSGRKTLELRTRPPQLKEPVQTLIYETSPTCRIRVVCEMGPVLSDQPGTLWDKMDGRSRVQKDEYDKYFEGRSQAHAIEVRRARELQADITLDRLRREANFTAPNSWIWATVRLLEVLERLFSVAL